MNPPNARVPAYFALVLAVTSLSLSAMFVRWADAPGPVTAFYRFTFGAAILLPFFVRQCRTKCTITRENIKWPILAGIFTGFDLTLWTISLSYTTAANATLLGNTAPLWVALVAWIFLKEKLRGQFWIGLALAIGGAALVVSSDFILHPRLGIGDLLAIGTGAFYAGYYIMTQRSRAQIDAMSHIWILAVTAAGLTLVFNLLMGNPLFGYSAATWGAFIGAGLVSQVIGYWAVSYALGHLPASIVSPTMIGQPILTALLAIPLLGEVPTFVQVVGGLLALLGIYIVNQSHGAKSPPAEPLA